MYSDFSVILPLCQVTAERQEAFFMFGKGEVYGLGCIGYANVFCCLFHVSLKQILKCCSSSQRIRFQENPYFPLCPLTQGAKSGVVLYTTKFERYQPEARL